MLRKASLGLVLPITWGFGSIRSTLQRVNMLWQASLGLVLPIYHLGHTVTISALQCQVGRGSASLFKIFEGLLIAYTKENYVSCGSQRAKSHFLYKIQSVNNAFCISFSLHILPTYHLGACFYQVYTVDVVIDLTRPTMYHLGTCLYQTYTVHVE